MKDFAMSNQGRRIGEDHRDVMQNLKNARIFEMTDKSTLTLLRD